jgi:20S proteasome subunit alpha 7
MSSTGAGYDSSAGQYSPDGRVFQVEYAQKAVDNSGSVMAVRCSDGIVMGVEKLLISKMLVEGTGRRLHSIDTHVGIGTAGLQADGRGMIARARSEARSYRSNYGMPIPPSVLSQRLAGVMHQHTTGYGRPIGCSAIIIGRDEDKKDTELYMVEPSGIAFRYFGCAAGKGRQAAKTEIEKDKLFDRTCAEVCNDIAKILAKLHDEANNKPYELELSWVCEATGWKHELVPKAVRDAAVQWAKDKLEEEEMEDDDDDDDE